MLTQIGPDGHRIEVDEDAEVVTAPPVTESQIGEDGTRRPFDELGVDPEAPVDNQGLAEGAVKPTLVPIEEGTQINAQTGVREQVDVDAIAAVAEAVPAAEPAPDLEPAPEPEPAPAPAPRATEGADGGAKPTGRKSS